MFTVHFNQGKFPIFTYKHEKKPKSQEFGRFIDFYDIIVTPGIYFYEVFGYGTREPCSAFQNTRYPAVLAKNC